MNQRSSFPRCTNRICELARVDVWPRSSLPRWSSAPLLIMSVLLAGRPLEAELEARGRGTRAATPPPEQSECARTSRLAYLGIVRRWMCLRRCRAAGQSRSGPLWLWCEGRLLSRGPWDFGLLAGGPSSPLWFASPPAPAAQGSVWETINEGHRHPPCPAPWLPLVLQACHLEPTLSGTQVPHLEATRSEGEG